MLQSNSKNRRRGAVAVELAICLPIFLLIFFAAFEFCRANMIRHTADNAAYEAARRVVVPGATADDARSTASSMLNIIGVSDATIDVEPAVIEATTPEVTVSLTVPLNSNLFLVPVFLKNKLIETSFTLSREKYEQTVVP